MVEKKVFQKLRNLKVFQIEESSTPLDDDVETEKRRVLDNSNSPDQRDVLTVTNLQKQYGKLKAVDGLNFGVHFGECFGFLGVNGAGKTTSFK